MPAKRILVEINRQVLTAFLGDEKVYEFDCTTGDSSHPTPKGKFKILRKHEKYTSKTYKVPMDHAMFFTNTGEAIHQAYAVTLTSWAKYFGIGAIGSHGCVRLSESNATTLFKWAQIGTEVEVK